MRIFLSLAFLMLLFVTNGCRNTTHKNHSDTVAENQISYATGLKIFKYEGYSTVHVSDPWPESNTDYKYVLAQKGAVIPDSLKAVMRIQVPIEKAILTSTTHIPSLEMLSTVNTLVGFPNLEFISSPKVRSRIDNGKIREIGSNQNLNTEIILDLGPDVIVAHGIDNNNPILENLMRSGQKVLFNGDWNEKTALGKAEWIKFFGALYGKEALADSIFDAIADEYHKTIELASQATKKPTVLSGALYENHWYLPQGGSWGALLIEQAGGNYLWRETEGTGSLSLPFETVLDRAENAEVWIGPGQFTSIDEMLASNRHYGRFAAFKNKNVYSYSSKKGKTGGIIYFELAPNRPDLVIKDLVKILHPELLPDYELYFFEKIR